MWGSLLSCRPIVNRPFDAVTNRAQDTILPRLDVGNKLFAPLFEKVSGIGLVTAEAD